MKKINLIIKSCSECPYFGQENVLADSGKYELLFTCKKEYTGLVYDKDIREVMHNNPNVYIFEKVCKLEDYSKFDERDE